MEQEERIKGKLRIALNAIDLIGYRQVDEEKKNENMQLSLLLTIVANYFLNDHFYFCSFLKYRVCYHIAIGTLH